MLRVVFFLLRCVFQVRQLQQPTTQLHQTVWQTSLIWQVSACHPLLSIAQGPSCRRRSNRTRTRRWWPANQLRFNSSPLIRCSVARCSVVPVHTPTAVCTAAGLAAAELRVREPAAQCSSSAITTEIMTTTMSTTATQTAAVRVVQVRIVPIPLLICAPAACPSTFRQLRFTCLDRGITGKQKEVALASGGSRSLCAYRVHKRTVVMRFKVYRQQQ